MQSNRFYGSLPQSTPSSQSLDNCESSSFTLSLILTELKQQGNSIKYLEQQKDGALQLADSAKRC